MLMKRVKSLGVGLAVCECGHLQCDHCTQLAKLECGVVAREHNHGGCVECKCKQFTFSRFVSLEVAAEMMGDREIIPDFS